MFKTSTMLTLLLKEPFWKACSAACKTPADQTEGLHSSSNFPINSTASTNCYSGELFGNALSLHVDSLQDCVMSTKTSALSSVLIGSSLASDFDCPAICHAANPGHFMHNTEGAIPVKFACSSSCFIEGKAGHNSSHSSQHNNHNDSHSHPCSTMRQI